MCRNGCKFYWDVERIQTITKKLKINKKIHQLKEVYNIKKLWGTKIKLFYDQQLLSIISLVMKNGEKISIHLLLSWCFEF